MEEEGNFDEKTGVKKKEKKQSVPRIYFHGEKIFFPNSLARVLKDNLSSLEEKKI